MSSRELSRYEVISRLIRREINGTDAAKMTELSTRQIRRLKAIVREKGPTALIHGNRGRKSNRRIRDKERSKIIRLLHERYSDFWPSHASEKLNEIHGIKHDAKTIRAIMIEEELWEPRHKKRSEHREWRQRRAHFGEMQQFDGSYHAWFEGRIPGKQCLLLAVDDATGKITHAKFDEHEGFFPVAAFWQEYLQIYGKPLHIYLDRFSTYSMNQKLAKENPDTLTQFQRAMAALQIDIILAQSPEAKGRVETIFGTLQNRLVKEMRLRNINSIEEANKYLKEEFIPWYNSKYAITARSKTNFHKKLNKIEQKCLSDILCRHEGRTIQNDFTVMYGKRWFQLSEKQSVTVQKRDKVIVSEHRDGSIQIRLRGKSLNYSMIEKGKRRPKTKVPWIIPATNFVREHTKFN